MNLKTVVFLIFNLSGVNGPVHSKLICSHEPIEVFAGDDVILPCHLEPPISVSSETVMWTRSDLDPEFVHVHQDGRLIYENQNPSYYYRTRLFVDELINGNVSMKIFKVKSSDSGIYKCSLPSIQKEAFIELIVHTKTDTEDYPVVCPKSVTAEPDTTVILNCHTEPKKDLTDDTVRWRIQKKTTQKKDNILQYRQGELTLDKAYEDRASIFIDQLSEGNCSLKLEVKSTESGTYHGSVTLGGPPFTCSFSLTVREASKGDVNTGDDGGNNIIIGVSVGVAVLVIIFIVVAVLYCRMLFARCRGEQVPQCDHYVSRDNNLDDDYELPPCSHTITRMEL